MKFKSYSATLLMTVSMGIAMSCTDTQYDMYPSNGSANGMKPESEYFDFETTGDVALNLQYGPLAAHTLLEVYISDPYVGISYEDSITKEADFKIFADENGGFKGYATLPTYTDSIWVVANGYGLPHVLSTKVANNTANISIADNSNDAATRAITRGDAAFSSPITIDANKKLYSIVDVTTKRGKIDYSYNSSLFSDGKIELSSIKAVQYLLWGKKDKKEHGVDNSKLAVDAQQINTTISETYEDAGVTKTVKSAKVYLTFLHERADRESTLGYYYYKTDSEPTNADELEKFVIVPNASMKYDRPYDTSGMAWKAPFSQYSESAKNKRIQLLFKDPATGQMTEDFPAGYTIGYFVICDGWGGRYTTDEEFNANHFIGVRTQDNDTYSFYYSNSNLHKSYWGKRFMSLNMPDGHVVYGIETSTYRIDKDAKYNKNADMSLDDILFTIDATPNFAIQNPERPSVDPEVGEIFTTETTCKTYAFEDCWPYGGDYDMNDVIIAHKRIITFGSFNNEVTTVVDEFTPVQKEGSAVNRNTFAAVYRDDADRMTLDKCMVYEADTKSIIVTTNTNADFGKTFKVTRYYTGKNMRKEDIKTIDPYLITTPYKIGAVNDNRTEVHLPKRQPTSLANKSQIGLGSDAYYVDKNNDYPFALCFQHKEYVPVEGLNISIVYPNFDEWVKSNGHCCPDWYLR